MSTYKKHRIVAETKELAYASRINTEIGNVIICERTFTVLPKVFDPRVFFSTQWFASSVSRLVSKESAFCEIGCGTGAVVITVTLDNPRISAVAADINPYAVENTKQNVERHNLNDRVTVFESDVFSGIPKNMTFDSIFWAMPFGYIEEDEPTDIVDLQTFDPGYRSIRAFFQEAQNYLKQNGRLLVGFSHEIGTDELLEEIVKENGYSIKLLTEEKGTEKSPVTMQIYEIKK